MTISLYDISVPQYLQILTGASGFLEKGLAHCREKGIDPESLVEARLYEDMQPLRFQVHQVIRHSLDAVGALKTGEFSPGTGAKDDNFQALIAGVSAVRVKLDAIKPEELNARAGTDVVFSAGGRQMRFTAENFIFSFSLPNFYFHAATAYDILRMKGVPVGKRDFMGFLRLKT